MLDNVTLSRKKETFVAALLTLPTIEAAATAAGVSSKTAHAWLKEEKVQELYQKARRDAFASSLEALMDVTGDAIDTLKGIMTNKKTAAAVRVRAAQIVLDKAIEVHKTEELEERIQELEQAMRRSEG